MRIRKDTRLDEVERLNIRSRGILDMRALIAQAWVMSRYLYQWLGYCLRQGHCPEQVINTTVEQPDQVQACCPMAHIKKVSCTGFVNTT